MTPSTPLPSDARRRGWCPGALRPMQSGDGLLVRVKPSSGILSLDQAAAIATLASAHGNGLIELTSRGNLQLRGVAPETLAPLTTALDALGLLDATPEAEAVRNVIATPLAGLDTQAFDTRAVVRALELALVAATDLQALSDKFGFVVDGGGRLPLGDVEADIRFRWIGSRFAVGLAREAGCDWVGTCAADAVSATALGLTGAFLALAPGARRMRHVDDDTRHHIAVSGSHLRSDPIPPSSMRRNDEEGSTTVSKNAHLSGAGNAVTLSGSDLRSDPIANGLPIAGIGLAFGATSAEALAELLTHARQLGAAEVRLTPWRALLIPVADAGAADTLRRNAARLGFVADLADPRRTVAACPGAPACANGSTPTRTDAARFADAASALLAAGATMHVSGCAKGCAHRRPATITLVADAGRYGLVVNATATAAPAARYMAEQAAETLARLAQAMTKAQCAAHPASEAGTAAILQEALKEIEAA
jgi:precorrin-3B synthase